MTEVKSGAGGRVRQEMEDFALAIEHGFGFWRFGIKGVLAGLGVTSTELHFLMS